jgi:hypothetical protein
MSERDGGHRATVMAPAAGPNNAAAAAMAQRGEFIRAFVEHAGDRPASERLTVKAPTLITVTAVTAATAIVIGVFWSMIKPLPAEKKAAAKAPAATASPTDRYIAVAGWDCGTADDRGFDAQGRTSAWRTVAVGGWSQDGCHGTFETLPMTEPGKGGIDHPQAVLWWFSPGAAAKCQINVFVPRMEPGADGVEGAHAPHAAHYSVLAGRSGTSYADFTVDQAANAGEWVSAGSFPVHNNGISVRLTGEGDAKEAGSRLGVAQMKVDCAR